MMSRFSPGVSWFPWEPSFQVTNLLFFQSFSLHGPVHKWVREQEQSRSSGEGFLWGTGKKKSWKRKERCEWQREAGHGLDLKTKKKKKRKVCLWTFLILFLLHSGLPCCVETHWPCSSAVPPSGRFSLLNSLFPLFPFCCFISAFHSFSPCLSSFSSFVSSILLSALLLLCCCFPFCAHTKL